MYFIISYLCQMCWSWSPWHSSKVEIILTFIAPILQEYAKRLMFYRYKKDTAMSCGWSLLALPAVLKGWSFWQSVHCLNLNSATFWDLKINLSRCRMCQYIHLPNSVSNLPSTAPVFLTTIFMVYHKDVGWGGGRNLTKTSLTAVLSTSDFCYGIQVMTAELHWFISMNIL